MTWSAARADIPASERVALAAIYASTHGDGWSNNNGWNGAPGTECSWYGVYCNVAGTHVTFVELDGNNLTGALPALADLTQLSGFKAVFNNLGGAIPRLDQLAKLEIFDVNRNQLTGSIPSLSGLSLLSDFEVWDNQLSGSLPSLAGLSNLAGFYAFNNQLTGPIPALAGLTNLAEFHLYGNQLTGPIPPLGGLASLSEFEVEDNQLTGPIPDLAGLPLTVLRVGGNHLDGTLPAAPNTLQAAASSLCLNYFPGSSYIDDPAWDAATGMAPWYATCDAVFSSGFQGP